MSQINPFAGGTQAWRACSRAHHPRFASLWGPPGFFRRSVRMPAAVCGCTLACRGRGASRRGKCDGRERSRERLSHCRAPLGRRSVPPRRRRPERPSIPQFPDSSYRLPSGRARMVRDPPVGVSASRCVYLPRPFRFGADADGVCRGPVHPCRGHGVILGPGLCAEPRTGNGAAPRVPPFPSRGKGAAGRRRPPFPARD